ncbi:MAG TPA: phage major capsid protein [Desertimonas sp.]|nr:phage major capsid protein [Desertimonas sp.]
MAATAIEDTYADLQSKIEECIRHQNTIVGDARGQNRDLTAAEAEMVQSKTEQIKGYRAAAAPLIDQISVAADSRKRSEELSQALALVRRPEMGNFQYRSAGHYVLDNIKAVRGDREAADRLDWYNRVAAHQTTTNAAGVVPQEIVGSVINFIDSSRPLVTALGARPLEGGPNFYRPRVTTHTSVAKQSAEKAEFSSTAMVLDKLTATVDTYGGYVNVSRQIIDWSSPAIMDIIVGDLAAQYAIQTETAAAAQFLAAATAGTVIPTGATTADAVAAAVWAAVGTIYTTIPNAGHIVGVSSPSMLSAIGPALTATAINNPNSTGFAIDYTSGQIGSIGGVPIYLSPRLTGATLLIIHPAAAEVYDQIVGMLSVTEPSVGGVQVAYMGYFSALTVAAGGIVKITKTP